MKNNLIIKIYQQRRRLCIVISEVKGNGSGDKTEYCCKFIQNKEESNIVHIEKYNVSSNLNLKDTVDDDHYICKPFICSFYGLKTVYSLKRKIYHLGLDKKNQIQLSDSSNFIIFLYDILGGHGGGLRLLKSIDYDNKSLLSLCRYHDKENIHKYSTITNLIHWISEAKYKHLQDHPETREKSIEGETAINRVINKQFSLYAGVSILGLVGGLSELIYAHYHPMDAGFLKPTGWLLACVSSIALVASYCRESPTLIRPALNR